jgi:hypothetical protein
LPFVKSSDPFLIPVIVCTDHTTRVEFGTGLLAPALDGVLVLRLLVMLGCHRGDTSLVARAACPARTRRGPGLARSLGRVAGGRRSRVAGRTR